MLFSKRIVLRPQTRNPSWRAAQKHQFRKEDGFFRGFPEWSIGFAGIGESHHEQ